MGYTNQQIKDDLALYDKLGKVTATVRTLGYPAKHTLYEWVNLRKATNGKFPDIEHNGIKYIRNTIRLDHDGISAEEKLKILKRCFEGTENIRDVAIEYAVSRTIIYRWRKLYLKEGIFGLQQKRKLIKRTCSFEKTDIDLPNNSTVEVANSKELEQLRKQVKDLQMKVDVMSEVFDLLKKGQGTNIDALSNKEKHAVISALKNKYSILSLLKLLSLSKSSYYYIESSSKQEDKYSEIRTLIKEIFDSNYHCYGYRRLYIALKQRGYTVSEKVVRSLMKQESLSVKKTKRKRYSSYLGELSPAVDNVIARDFKATAPNQKWLTDISEFAINSGKVYLSVIRDCYNDEIISYKLSFKPTAALANDTLVEAIAKLKEPNKKPIVHSDRGCHYRWPNWIKIMNDNGLVRSMSRKGCSPDNAACEGFFGRMKTECFYNHSFQNFSKKDFIEYTAYARIFQKKFMSYALSKSMRLFLSNNERASTA